MAKKEEKPGKSKLRKKLDADETFARYKRIIDNANRVNLEELLKEAVRLHSTRSVRSLSAKTSVGSKSLSKALSEDQSYRSRIVELIVQIRAEYNPLNVATLAIRDHLNSKYSRELGVRTVAERESTWRKLTQKGSSRLEELSNAVETLEYVIEDIDKAGYALRNMVDLLQLTTKTER